MSDRNIPTDHASRLRYWAAHPAGQVEPMRAELLNAADEIERLDTLRMQAEIEKDASVGDVTRLGMAIRAYVLTAKDHKGEAAARWWTLQEIAREFSPDVGDAYGS